jgi:hypothetical protein
LSIVEERNVPAAPVYQALAPAQAAGAVICDGFRLTLPNTAGEDLARELLPLWDTLGLADDGGGRFRRGGSGGVLFKRGAVGGVTVFSFTGALCADLRKWGMLGDLVAPCAGYPRRQTRTDVALDLSVRAAPVLGALYDTARRGVLSLSAKRIPGDKVRRIVGVGIDGEDTGTVYLGDRATSRVYAAVYDKRQERIDRGHGDPGPLLRVEVRVGDVAAGLGDVVSPQALFFHYAAPALISRPADVPAWVAHGEGFALPPRREYSPEERLRRFVEESADIGRALDLAAAIQPGGEAQLLGLLQTRARMRQNALSATQQPGDGAEPHGGALSQHGTPAGL